MNRVFGKTDVKKFAAWVKSSGGEILSNTNAWELLRFKGNGVVSIIYRNKKGDLSFMGESEAAIEAWLKHKPYRFCKSTKLNNRNRSVIEQTLTVRDGYCCFYCAEEFSDELPPTIEHLVARTHGGPNHISNKFLACQPCNKKAGHLSAPEKIAMRDQMRAPPFIREQISSGLSQAERLDVITAEMREIL